MSIQYSTLRGLIEAASSFAAFSCSYWVGFLLVANFSLFREDASLAVLVIILLYSFTRFALLGSERWAAFSLGVILSWSWFLIGFAMLDWAIGQGPGPTDVSFYFTAVKFVSKPESLVVMLILVSVVAFAGLLGCGLGLLARRLRMSFSELK